MKKYRRVVVISDTHCGHRAGLCSPDYQYEIKKNPRSQTIRDRNKFAVIQREIWSWYAKTMKDLQPIDTLFHLGDCIDGNSPKNSGIEEMEVDRLKQCDIAVDCINESKAKNIILIRGTDYHVGGSTEYENVVYDRITPPGSKKIGNHEWVEFFDGKIIFDLKHKVGNTTVPYSQGTSISKDRYMNLLWAERDLQPKANIFIRGHIHKDFFAGDSDFLSLSMPSLQWTTNYGAKVCSSRVSVGLAVFDLCSDGTYSWCFKLAKLNSMKTSLIKL